MNMQLHHLRCLTTSLGRYASSVRNKTSTLSALARMTVVLVFVAIGSAQLFAQEESVEQYDQQYRKATAEFAQLSKTIMRRLQVQSVDGSRAEITEEDRQKLRELSSARMGFLNKLISLAPENDEYRFELATLIASRGDKSKAVSILEGIAPIDAAGYPQAHFELAKFYLESKTANGIKDPGNLDIALKHIDHVLSRDEKNVAANLLKAKIFVTMQRNESAYQVFDGLLSENPNFFPQMVELNKRLGRQERDRQVFERALASFENLAAMEENQTNDSRWVAIEGGIAAALQKLDRYEDAESRLNELIEVYSADPKGEPRRVYLERLLSGIYVAWANEVADPQTSYDSLSADASEKLLDLLTKAYRNNPDNVLTLQSIARLSQSSNAEIADKAKAVYDATADPNAPSQVLNQLGNHALLDEDFAEAIQYYERAREKMPRDPAVLNNLAYAYAVAEGAEGDAARALKLVDEAIRNLPKNISNVEMSKFLHTKATVLEKQDRLAEAIEIYEESLKARPNDADTLRSLIGCYKRLNKQPPEDYAARLEKLGE